MRRIGDFAAGTKSRTAVAPAPEPERQGTGCAAYGCPLAGGISSSTLGGGPWHCRFHFGAEPSQFDAITTEIRRTLRGNGGVMPPPGPSPTVVDMLTRVIR